MSNIKVGDIVAPIYYDKYTIVAKQHEWIGIVEKVYKHYVYVKTIHTLYKDMIGGRLDVENDRIKVIYSIKDNDTIDIVNKPKFKDGEYVKILWDKTGYIGKSPLYGNYGYVCQVRPNKYYVNNFHVTDDEFKLLFSEDELEKFVEPCCEKDYEHSTQENSIHMALDIIERLYKFIKEGE